jgi:hypothetical protein
MADGAATDSTYRLAAEGVASAGCPEQQAAQRARHPVWLAALGAAWLAAAGAGLWVVLAYANAPGLAADAPVRWPSDSRIARDAGGPTLVMLAHPQCTCTRASLDELAEVLARSGNETKTYVLFIKPPGFSEGWEQSDLWQKAARIPGVTPLLDAGGIDADRFGAWTSGQTMLYDAEGRLLFSGGITGARAHPGDNEGRAALLALLTRARAGKTRTSVFGCPLFAPGL